MKINKFSQTLEEALKNGCRFCSFMYRSKGAEDTAIYTVLLGVNLINAYKRDKKILESIHTDNPIMEAARKELISSLSESIEKGLGNNHRFTQKGVYQFLGKSVRLHKEENQIHLTGFIIRKEIIKAGEPKFVKSAPKTICKKQLAKRMKCRKFRDFIFNPDNIGGLKINGNILEIQNTI